MDLPIRKQNRLSGYDYCMPGYYFITICSHNKEKLFWNDSAKMQLSGIGKIVEQKILSIPPHYPGVLVDKYVIMPNHIHLILVIEGQNGTSPQRQVPIIIGQMKRAASAEAQRNIWQRSYHDHIIRDESEYQKIWLYIDVNRTKWTDDCYYIA